MFLTPLRVERIDDRRWRLTGPLAWSDGEGNRLMVPVGFVTDFASIPGWLPKSFDVAQPAAVLHDWLYQTHERTKGQADRIFWRAMTDLEEPWWRKQILYQAVRWFGGPAYASGPERCRTECEATL